MADKSWMLKPQAIRYAKECIALIKDERGVRLKLSQPNFIQVLHEYVEIIGSKELGDAYARLISMAGVGFVVQNLPSREQLHAMDMGHRSAVGSAAMES